jgi:hypothetical protein
MRRFWIMCGPALAVCALAVAAVPASAHQFTAGAVGKAFPLKTKGVGVGRQVFKFGKIGIECEAATSKGTVAESPTPLLKVEVAYKECEAHVSFIGEEVSPKVRFKSKVEYVYHPNGFAVLGTGGEPETVEVGPGTVELSIAHTGGCKVLLPKQTVPVKAIKKPEEEYSAAVFTPEEVASTKLKPFPSGFQDRLKITNEFKAMEFGIEEAGLCEEFSNTEGKGGRYEGALQVEVPSGNLGFE